jgi:hypothetical protein
MNLEIAHEGERLFDFCLWEYPAAAPCAGRLRSVNLLRHSFEAEGVAAEGEALIEALRASLGASNTVWGIKQAEGRISWEFYFYDYERQHRQRSIPRVLAALAPRIRCTLAPGEQLPYFMFSLDFDHDRLAGRVPLEDVQVYIGNIGSRVSSGICYEATSGGLRLKNQYYFFDARTERENIAGKATTSVHFDPARVPLAELLWPELFDCETIVLANKIDRDGVYFCRIDIDQLLHFLRRLQFPSAQLQFVEQHRDGLDHMRFDVGFDYRMDGGRLQIVKGAWYGVF